MSFELSRKIFADEKIIERLQDMGYLDESLSGDEQVNNVLKNLGYLDASDFKPIERPLKKFTVELLHMGYKLQSSLTVFIEAHWYGTKYGVLSFYKNDEQKPFKVFGPGFWISCEECKGEEPEIYTVDPGPK